MYLCNVLILFQTANFWTLPNGKHFADEILNLAQFMIFSLRKKRLKTLLKKTMLVNSIVSFLAPLAVGQRAYVMARCPSCVRPSARPSVRPSVRALTFSLNIFFAETTYRILMKFHRNVPTMVLFRIS